MTAGGTESGSATEEALAAWWLEERWLLLLVTWYTQLRCIHLLVAHD